jgi:hypothetical protein
MQRPGPPGWRLGVGLTILSCKKKIVEKPPRNSAGFFGGGQGLSWAVEPRKEKKVSKVAKANIPQKTGSALHNVGMMNQPLSQRLEHQYWG